MGGLGRMLGLSLAGHLGLLAGLWGLGLLFAPWRTPPRQVVMARLVRLGTPRPKEQLPRLSSDAAATVAPKAPAPAAAASPPVPPPQPKPVAPGGKAVPLGPSVAAGAAAPSDRTARDRARSLGRLRQALDRIKAETTGQADGDAAGDAEDAVAGERYSAEIDACLRRNYIIEGYAAERVAGVSAEVVLRVSAAGHIVGYRLAKSSGIAAFDQAVGRAVSRCGKLSPPPPHLRRAIGQEGIEITFKP